MREAGGGAIVELSVGGLKPDPEGLVAISQATDVAIVMGCGHYVEEYQDAANHSRTPEDFAAEMVQQLTVGAGGTSVRAGIIGEIVEIQCSGMYIGVYFGAAIAFENVRLAG